MDVTSKTVLIKDIVFWLAGAGAQIWATLLVFVVLVARDKAQKLEAELGIILNLCRERWLNKFLPTITLDHLEGTPRDDGIDTDLILRSLGDQRAAVMLLADMEKRSALRKVVYKATLKTLMEDARAARVEENLFNVMADQIRRLDEQIPRSPSAIQHAFVCMIGNIIGLLFVLIVVRDRSPLVTYSGSLFLVVFINVVGGREFAKDLQPLLSSELTRSPLVEKR